MERYFKYMHLTPDVFLHTELQLDKYANAIWTLLYNISHVSRLMLLARLIESTELS